MFSKEFGLGLAEGLFESADESITKYLDKDDTLSTKLAEKRIERSETESARWQQEYITYKKELENLLNKVGGSPDDLQYILDELGYEEGKKQINSMWDNHQNKGGPKIQDLFKLKNRMGKGVTINQLARYYTVPISVAKLSSYKDLGGGMSKLFGGEEAFQKAVQRKSQIVDELPGMKLGLDDMPEVALADVALRKYRLGTLADPAQEVIRLQRLGTQALENGDFNLAEKIKSRYITVGSLASIEENKSQQLSTTDKERIKNHFLDYISDEYGLGGNYDSAGNYIFPATSIAIFNEATETASALQIAAIEYIKKGVPYATVIAKLEEAIRKNAFHDYIDPKNELAMFDIGQIMLTPPKDNTQKGLMDTSLFQQDPLAAIDFGYFPQYENNLDSIKNELELFASSNMTDTDIEMSKQNLTQLGVSSSDIEIMLNKLTGI